MFSINTAPKNIVVKKNTKSHSSYKIYPQNNKTNNTDNTSNIDIILENEKQYNKKQPWNKLDKTVKMQKLETFALKYSIENNYDVQKLKTFFIDCLNQKKLQKKKDLLYDKDTYEIISIPSLDFNVINDSFTLKNLDTKRVSTLKSLTPKRNTEKRYFI